MRHANKLALGFLMTLWANVAAAQTCGLTAPKPISTTVEADVSASESAVFAFTVAEDVLPKVLWNHGIIPGVSHTQVLLVPTWDQPGALRIVTLNDGNTANEEITDFTRPEYFAYKVFNFTGMMGTLVQEAHGQWWFTEQDGVTRVKWTYTFVPKCGLSTLALDTVVVPQFHGYMQDAISRIKTDVEEESDETE